MATKILQEKTGQTENPVKRRNRCRMEYTNIRQRKVEGVGKGLYLAVG